jgi:hypothetical protein
MGCCTAGGRNIENQILTSQNGLPSSIHLDRVTGKQDTRGRKRARVRRQGNPLTPSLSDLAHLCDGFEQYQLLIDRRLRSPLGCPCPDRSKAQVQATGPLVQAIAGCRVAAAACRSRSPLMADATLPVSARPRCPRSPKHCRDGYPAAACLAGQVQSAPDAVATPLELEQARAEAAGGYPGRERT